MFLYVNIYMYSLSKTRPISLVQSEKERKKVNNEGHFETKTDMSFWINN